MNTGITTLQLNRDDPATWANKGGQRYGERVTHKTLEILATHQPEPLPEDVAATLEEIARRAEDELAQVKFVSWPLLRRLDPGLYLSLVSI